MPKPFIKITALLLIIGLNWFGLSAIGETLASFNDTENSPENIYQARTLDFSLESLQSNFGPRPEVVLNMMPGDSVTREIKIKNEGSLPFQYTASTIKIMGDDDFCQGLELVAQLEGDIKYSGDLMSFDFPAVEISDPEDNWFFIISLPYSSNFVNKTCRFKFVFEGWQTDFPEPSAGFYDSEEVASHLASWGLRINEVYYDVAPDKGTEPKNEWIEIYNPTDQDINVKNWIITDNTYSRTIAANITIPTSGFAVVSKDASTWAPGTGYWTLPPGTTEIILGQNIGNGLANDGDRLILSRPDGLEVDAMSYGNDITIFNLSGVAEGHSLARRIAGFDTNQASDWEDLATPNPGTNPGHESLPNVVLNEFLSNPLGDDCNLERLEGEWVEIYNRGLDEVDLKNWYLLDSEDNKIIISEGNTHTGFTIIEAKGSGNEWLVVFLNDCILNNEGDTVTLYDDNDVQVDSYSYTGSVPENKSFARYPDGSEKWYDPIPTPGAPNKLEVSTSETSTSTEQTVTSTEEIATTTEEIATSTEEIATFTEEITIATEATTTEATTTEETKATDEATTTPTEEATTTEESPANEEVPTNETPTVEEQPATEEQPVIEETSNEESTTTEDTPIIEEAPVIEEATTTDESATATVETEGDNANTTEDAVVTEETPVQETPIEKTPIEDSLDSGIEQTPAAEEQPATVPEDSYSNSDGAGESSGDGGGDV